MALLVVAVALVVAITLVLALAAGALAPIDPVAYVPPEAPALVGPLASNSLLRDQTRTVGNEVPGPEDVDVDAEGRIYCGLEDGTVRRLDPAKTDSRFEVFATTGGRPLGLDFDPAGTLWIADMERGLLSIDRAGAVTSRSTEAAGAPVTFADDVAVAPDGKVYFSDATWRSGHDALMLEVFEARPNGRLLEYDPATERTRVVLDGLYFANGVAVSPEGDFVVVAETFRYRIRRVWLRGPRAGFDEVLVDNLPGFPDGVASDGQGVYWVALYDLRSGALDGVLHPRPWLKHLIVHLPRFLTRRRPSYGLILAIDQDGRILRSLHDPSGRKVSGVTSVEPVGATLYLGTVEGRHVIRVSLETDQ